jgi:hypothetical protein
MQPQPVIIDPREREAQILAIELLRQLQIYEPQVANKYAYYEADHDTRDFGISTPRKMLHHRPGIGWASRAVNTLSDRVNFDGFAHDTYGVNNYFTQINATAVISQGKHDTAVAGCAFIAILDNNEDDPAHPKILVPFTAEEATGVINSTTGLLKYGLAVTRWQKPQPNPASVNRQIRFAPADFIVFTQDYTAVFEDRALVQLVLNPTRRCLLQPLTHRASARQPLGKSRLTKTARRIIQEVGRQKRREEIAEEFYSLPQRYITGLAEGAKKDPKLDSSIGIVWAIPKDEDGNAPTVGQLQQMSIDGFVGAKKDKARDFCAETALTLRNLGYETGNPTSAESLSAMSDDLLLEATNWQDELGNQIKNIAITLRMSIDGVSDVPDAMNELVPAWKPIFQLNVGAAGDAIGKIQAAMPEFIGSIASYRMLGVSIREAEELVEKRKAMAGSQAIINGGGGS